MRRLLVALFVVMGIAGAGASRPVRRPAPGAEAKRPILLAHYMPWFEAKPLRAYWGWHWTMNHFDPDKREGERQQAASHYRPLIGLYDSSDPEVLECQLLQMKLAGIDGVIIDWYGPDDYLDYRANHRNSLLLVAALKKAGLRFAVCYEDQTVPRLIVGKVVDPANRVEHGRKVMRWLAEHWFNDPGYVRLEGQPLFLVFGPQFYKEDQWKQIFAALPAPPTYFSLHHRREPAIGAFDWPQPASDLGIAAVDSFYKEASPWPAALPVAFPRFHDIYKEAGVGNSHGRIDDDGGKTYANTLERALRSGAAAVQLATWNDWSEGTMIEPSVEFGYRDLEKTQSLHRTYRDPQFRFTPSDLTLPAQLLRQRREHRGEAAASAKLDMVARYLHQGALDQARRVLKELSPTK